LLLLLLLHLQLHEFWQRAEAPRGQTSKLRLHLQGLSPGSLSPPGRRRAGTITLTPATWKAPSGTVIFSNRRVMLEGGAPPGRPVLHCRHLCTCRCLCTRHASLVVHSPLPALWPPLAVLLARARPAARAPACRVPGSAQCLHVLAASAAESRPPWCSPKPGKLNRAPTRNELTCALT